MVAAAAVAAAIRRHPSHPPQAKYILDAVAFVADHGAAFLSSYRLNYKTGEWKHKTRFTRFPERR